MKINKLYDWDCPSGYITEGHVDKEEFLRLAKLRELPDWLELGEAEEDFVSSLEGEFIEAQYCYRKLHKDKYGDEYCVYLLNYEDDCTPVTLVSWNLPLTEEETEQDKNYCSKCKIKLIYNRWKKKGKMCPKCGKGYEY